MKKIMSTILVTVMCFTCLAACKKKTSETTAELTSTTEAITTTTSDSVTTTTSTAATSVSAPTVDPQGSANAGGEAYSKEVSKEDVVVDEETRIKYVKNQLLISCNIGTSKEEVEKICEEIGADIVGYIELTSDFQIEFKEDHTPDQLQEAADFIESHSFVLSVTLNMVEDITVE